MSGTFLRIRPAVRRVLPCLLQRNRVALGRDAMRGSTAPSCSMVTATLSGSRRATISLAERFWALVSASSANDGVKILIIGAKDASAGLGSHWRRLADWVLPF